MEITWYGHSCFRISERGKATIVTDPFNEDIGLAVPKLKADIVTVSHEAPGHSNLGAVKQAQQVIDRPGEYEIGGVFVIGVALHNTTLETPKRNIAYLFEFNGLSVVHLGDLDHIPSQATSELLGAANIALVPVGGGGGLNASQAADVIGLLEPNIVIPMHYGVPESKLTLDPLDRFLAEMGVSRVEEQEVFKVTSASSLPEQTQIVLLNANN